MARSDIKSVREFLDLQLKDPQMHHLIRWTNEREGKFQIFWLHAGRSSYNKNEHQKLFVKYRKYRGRTESEDPKQTFRMALKKSPHIQCLPVHQDDDWRYYIFKGRNNSAGMEIPRRELSLVDLPNSRLGQNNTYNDYDSAYGSTPPSPRGSLTSSPYRSQPPSPYYDFPSSPVNSPSHSSQQQDNNTSFYKYGSYLSPNDPFPPCRVPTWRPRALSESSTDHINNVFHSGGTCFIPETVLHRNNSFQDLIHRNTGCLLQNQDKTLISGNNSFLQNNTQESFSYMECQSNTASVGHRASISLSVESNAIFYTEKGQSHTTNSSLQNIPAPHCSISGNTIPNFASQCISETNATHSRYSQQQNQCEYTKQKPASESNVPNYHCADYSATGYGSIDDSPHNWTDNAYYDNIQNSTAANCSASTKTIPPIPSHCIPEITFTSSSYSKQQDQNEFGTQLSAQEFFEKQNQNEMVKHRSNPGLNSGYGPVDESPDDWADSYDKSMSKSSSHVASTTNSQEMEVQEIQACIPNLYCNSPPNTNKLNLLSNKRKKTHQEYIRSEENNMHSNITCHNPGLNSGYGPIDESPDDWADNYDNSMPKSSSHMASTTNSQKMEVQEIQVCGTHLYNNSSINTNAWNSPSTHHQNQHQGYIHSGENNMHKNILGQNQRLNSGYGPVDESPDNWADNYEHPLSKSSSHAASTNNYQEMEVQEIQACVSNTTLNSLSNQHQRTSQGYIHSSINNIPNNMGSHSSSFKNNYSNTTHSPSLQVSSRDIQKEGHIHSSQSSGYGPIDESPDLWMEDLWM